MLTASGTSAPRAAPAAAPRRLDVAILADLVEERWPSMDLVAGSLVRELDCQPALHVEPHLVRPRLLAVSRSWRRSNTVSTWERVLNRFWLYRRALRQVAGADVFHVVDHSYAHLALHLPRGRTVVTCHDIDAFAGHVEPGAQDSGLPSFLVRRLVAGLRRAAAVACPSQVTAHALVGAGLVSSDRVIVVPNGVDTVPLPGHTVQRMTMDVLGPITGGVELLHVGSTIQRKRIDLLLDVFAQVAAAIPHVRLIRVGGAFTPEQDARAAVLGVRDRIAVLPPLERRILNAVYSRAALVLVTSEREGFGLPVAEAMAAGTPVVASDLSVFREVAGDAATYAPLGDSGAWASIVLDLLEERQKRTPAWEERRAAARARAGVFSWARYAREMATIYRGLSGRLQDLRPPVAG